MFKPLNALLGILFFISALTSADTNIKPLFKATYSGKHMGIPVTLTRTLTHKDKNQYEYKSFAKGFPGSIEEVSQFEKGNTEYRPLSYSYTQKLFGVKKARNIQFNWSENTALYTQKNKKDTLHTLETGFLDSSLYQLALIRDLNNFEPNLSYTFIDKHKIKSFEFEIVNKSLSFYVNKKKYAAWQLKIKRDKDDKTSTLITVIPELFFHIAEIFQVEKDEKQYKITLTQLEIDSSTFLPFIKE